MHANLDLNKTTYTFYSFTKSNDIIKLLICNNKINTIDIVNKGIKQQYTAYKKSNAKVILRLPFAPTKIKVNPKKQVWFNKRVIGFLMVKISSYFSSSDKTILSNRVRVILIDSIDKNIDVIFKQNQYQARDSLAI